MRTFKQMRNTVRLAAGLPVVVVVAVLVAGCGGTKTLTHSALVTQANHVCQEANTQVSQLGAPTASVSALAKYARKVLPVSEQLSTRLAALKASSSDQANLSRLVAAVKNGDKGLKMMVSASTTAETNAASAVIIAQSVPKAATALGASTCANSPSA